MYLSLKSAPRLLCGRERPLNMWTRLKYKTDSPTSEVLERTFSFDSHTNSLLRKI